MLATVLLLALLLVATVTDLVWHKVYNWTTYPGILVALGLNAAGPLLVAYGEIDAVRLKALGWRPFSDSLAGLLACGVLMLVCFVMFRIGGGDVKLMAMLGAFLGWEEGITAMLWTFVLAACLAIIALIWRVGAARLVARAWRQTMYTLRLGQWSPLSAEERALLQPPALLGPSALAAVVIVRFGLGS